MSAKKTENAEKNFERARNTWANTLERQAAHLNAVCDEWARVEKKGTAQATQAVEEFAKVTQATIDYAVDLNVQFRTMVTTAVDAWSPSK